MRHRATYWVNVRQPGQFVEILDSRLLRIIRGRSDESRHGPSNAVCNNQMETGKETWCLNATRRAANIF
jgi:hypothetical protein